MHRRTPHFDRNDGIENAHRRFERGESRVLVWEHTEVTRLDAEAHAS